MHFAGIRCVLQGCEKRGESVFLAALVIPAGFIAIAAGFHVAPAAAVVLGFVHEQPSAVIGRAFAHVGKVI
jgi:hypothetical protein